jgi:glyoxylate reductase
MKVFITRIIPDIALEKIRDAGFEIVQWKEKRELTPEELIENCQSCDALISAGYNRINAGFLNASNHLKVIALHSVGYDNVDVSEATKLKIPIGNTPGVVSAATADVAFLLMLATSRKAFFQHQRIIDGDWKFFEPTANLGIELKGKTLGIFGLGKIGFELAKLCQSAYNMKIIYHNRSANTQAEQELAAKMVPFDELLQQSDIISVHTNLSDETRGKFDKPAFEKMKSSAIFINTSRGGIHNEKDLIDALKNKTIWGAGLDVTNPEPMSSDNELLKMPNVCVTPHIGTATVETRNAMASIVADNIIAGLRGEKIPFAVNPDVYE